MTDLEELLGRWAQEQRAAAGPAPDPRQLRDRRRRWLVPAAVAAVVLGLVTSGAMLATGRSNPAPVPAVATDDAVPWADLPPGPPYVPIPAPTPKAAQSRPCRAADLALSNPGVFNGGGGSLFDDLQVTNRSSSACRLDGRLDGMTGVNAGQRRRIRVVTAADAAWSDIGPTVLRPGHKGTVAMSWYARCDTGRSTADTRYTNLRVTLLGRTVPVAGAGVDLGCDPPTDGLSVSRLGRRGEEPRYLPDPVSTLTVSIAAPASVTAGRDLDYVVTLDNSGSSDVALEPCPNFLQALGGNVVKERHRLNCAAAHPVPAGGVETFRMRMHIPADTPPGRIMLRWFMERATTESPQATVVITTP